MTMTATSTGNAVTEIQWQRCPRCTRTLPVESFPERYRGANGNYCTECSREYQRNYSLTYVPPRKPKSPFVTRVEILCDREGCNKKVQRKRLLDGASRCARHSKVRKTNRVFIPGGKPGGSTAKGHGYQHQKLREKWRPTVETGTVECWRCGDLIPGDSQWDLGHVDGSRTEYRGPEHRTCNRATKRLDRYQQPTNPSNWWEE